MAKTAGVNGMAVAATGAGLLFVWSGVKGASVTSSLKSLLSGQQPKGTETSPLSSAGGSGGVSAMVGNSPAASGSAAINQGIARLLAAPYGWSTGQEWADLVSLWDRESSWSNTAKNPTSGAYGIPQALPPTKMPAAALPPTNSASAQISWGLSYIKSTYGSPSAAWAHEQSAGWY